MSRNEPRPHSPKWPLYALTVLAIAQSLYLLYGLWDNEKRMAFAVVDKGKLRINIYNTGGHVISSFPVAVGTNPGDKASVGDLRTPEGVFLVESVEDASTWKYDFKDGLGPVTGAYGPWFIRLKVPGASGIGIHGTHDNSTIGKRVSHGCIRMKNEDVEYLKKIVKVGTPVVITRDK